ncbi:hypothetical protein SAMN04487936_102474 [Halobacillus dabanensis]|uniref:Uncharacterized protein n=1 Tax=Halobacillus dabanensis TaxID=240302 RepID=A0A1I3S0D3_HALDA|nr:hypothetical protein [Halobacillus dabanensis]SFJ51622.1 hypothetical protein SAMN04487936_102474 [Halobacillus dabanensis]
MKNILGLLLLSVMIGCSEGPTAGSSSIPHQIGEPNDQSQLPDYRDWTAEEIYEQTEYEAFTGEFFKGLFTHNTLFMKKPGENVGSYEAFPDQTARVQLVERTEDLGKVELVEEKVLENGEKLSGELPEKTGVLYTYSQEILGDGEQVLDTDVVIYYVPKEEMNARMYVDHSSFSKNTHWKCM